MVFFPPGVHLGTALEVRLPVKKSGRKQTYWFPATVVRQTTEGTLIVYADQESEMLTETHVFRINPKHTEKYRKEAAAKKKKLMKEKKKEMKKKKIPAAKRKITAAKKGALGGVRVTSLPIGTQVAKQWEDRWYLGKLTQKPHPGHAYHHILYVDGDREDASMKEFEKLVKNLADLRAAAKKKIKK
ncbi:hypothetical protein TrVE_jg3320 [Triparma verrucosa]|uniref:Uncharacterized protein n=1 Tax=Triparma verrucosa TaxID=1606542 RepID=A0A9W7FEY4_9STRA|nr:hypothetical protein TrVE_jg3320 [Triparma verrucosa]